MSIEMYKGLLRNALVLGVKYLHMNRGVVGSYDKCHAIVKNYLEQNGFNFKCTNYAENTVVRRIVLVAEDMVYDDLSLEDAIPKLSKYLRIELI